METSQRGEKKTKRRKLEKLWQEKPGRDLKKEVDREKGSKLDEDYENEGTKNV